MLPTPIVSIQRNNEAYVSHALDSELKAIQCNKCLNERTMGYSDGASQMCPDASKCIQMLPGYSSDACQISQMPPQVDLGHVISTM